MDAADAGASPPYDPDEPVGVGAYAQPQALPQPQQPHAHRAQASVAGRKRHRDAEEDDDADYDVGQRPAFAVDDDDDDDAEGDDAYADADEPSAADYESAHASEYAAAAAGSATASSKRRRKDAAAEPAGPPATAEEYLRMVRREARRCPAVVVSAIDPRKFDSKQTSYMPKIERSAQCPPHLLPAAEWELSFASDFADLRQALVRNALQSAAHPTERPAFPLKSDSAGWVKFCLGTEWRFVEPAHVTLAVHRKRTAKQQPSSAAAAPAAAAAADDSDDDSVADASNAAEAAPVAANGAAAAVPAAGAAAGAGAGAAAAAAAALPCNAPPKAPRLPLLRALDHQRTRSLLLLLIDYLHAHVTHQQCRNAIGAPGGADAPATASAAAAAVAADAAAAGASEEQKVWPLTPLLSVWLFALTAKSEKPIDMSTAAALRTLYRDVCVLRARMTDAAGSAVARCNILLTIVHRCFDQKVDSA